MNGPNTGPLVPSPYKYGLKMTQPIIIIREKVNETEDRKKSLILELSVLSSQNSKQRRAHPKIKLLTIFSMDHDFSTPLFSGADGEGDVAPPLVGAGASVGGAGGLTANGDGDGDFGFLLGAGAGT